MNISGFAERHRTAIIFTISVLALAGIIAAVNLPISIFPDITFPRITVLADNGEEPAERMMVTITKPLEEAINSVPHVKNVRSKTARGSAEISINFEWGTDIILAQQLLQSRISSIRNQLPAAASVQVERMNATVFPVMGFALTSGTHSLVELRDIALYTLRPRLSRITGVSQVRIVGGKSREFLITADPVKLAAYNLDIRQISETLQKTNIAASVGLIDANYHLYLTLVNNMYTSVESIQNSVIGTRGAVPILLREVATVTPSEKEEYTRVTSDGREAVLINVIKQPDGNTVQIAEDVQSALDDVRGQIPKDIQLSNFYDQSDIIKQSFASVRDSIGIGIVLAVIILLLFLRSWRVTFVAAVIIPITVAITVLMLYVVKESFNIMTLGGIAAAIGLIIDDTIVVVENVFRHFRKSHEGFKQAVYGSVTEMFPAILGSSAATIVIHIPFAFLSGVTGAFFKSLSLTMVITLIVSFFLSLILAPLLASRFVSSAEFEKETGRTAEGKILRSYRKILSFLLSHRTLVIPLIVILALGSYFIYTRLGSSFMPEMDEGAFILDYAAPPGTSLNETDRMLREVEKIIMSFPEVESYSRRTGTEMGFFITEPYMGDYAVKLKKRRNRSADEIIDDLRQRIVSTQPALRIEFGEVIGDMVGDLTSVPSPIEIKLFGDNKQTIESAAKHVAQVIASVPGVVDVFNGITISGPAYVITFDEKSIGRAGLTVEDLQDEIETDIQGTVPSNIQYGEKLIGMRVRLPEAYRRNPDQMAGMKIHSPNGGTFLLGSLASISVDPGQSEINRENLKQIVAVTARLSNRDLGSTIADIQHRIRQEVVLPQGVSIRFGGEFETQQESFKGLLIVLAAASLLVFTVLLIEFESYIIAASIYLVTILSLFGSLLALYVTDVTFNISSFVGLILIVGAVAENSIFLVHYVLQFRRDGLSTQEAILNAGTVRLRPIIMTALAAILTLLPLALGLGAGTQMQQPLAIAVIGGFSMSSFLLLFVLPMILGMKRDN